MNGLSWFLYFADVLPTASVWLGILFIPTSFVGVILVICLPIFSTSENEVDVRTGKAMKPFAIWLPILAVVCLVISILIPSKETIYLIAGSEASEYAVTSEYGQEVLGDIKDIIKAHLNNLKETK